MSLLAEIQRRNVIRVGIAYLAAGWLLVQIFETLFSVFELSNSAIRVAVVVIGIGFVPALVLAWFFEMAPSGLSRDRGASSADHGRFDRIIMVLLGIALVYFSVDKFLLDPVRDSEREAAVARQAHSDAINASFGDLSIVVLPFVNMSDDTSNEYFSDGITEELLNVLGKVRDLRVISRTSAFSFKGQATTATEVAEKLNVSYVLEGSVRKAGNTVRITAQLIDARSDTQLWSETWDRELGDILKMQDEIATNVAEELKLKLLDQNVETIDPVAYEATLRARYLLNLYDPEKMSTVGTLIDSGLVRAPDYPPLLWEKSRFHTLQGIYGQVSEAEAKQERDMTQARLQRVVPDDPRRILFRAFAETDRQKKADLAVLAFQKAPTDVALVEDIARIARAIGRSDVGSKLGEYLVSRDPLCGRCFFRLGLGYLEGQKFEKAVAALQTATLLGSGNLDPTYALAIAHLAIGAPQAALDALVGTRYEQPQAHGRLLAAFDLGQEQEFLRQMSEFSQTADWHDLATIYAWSGDADRAFAYLELGYQENRERMASLFSDPLFKRIHDEPRWRHLMERLGTTPEQIGAISFDVDVPN